jgi:glycosyltransferase involved in cell wall biosynthesis
VVRNIQPKIKNLQGESSISNITSNKCIYPINCININPDFFYRLPIWLKQYEWREKYNIGYWFWELADAPISWKYAADFVDEIWVSSNFNLLAMKNFHSNVIKIPMGIDLKQSNTIFDLKKYGLNDPTFKFLTSFDFFSSLNRKNPIGTINAFLLAFPESHTNVSLIIKSTNGHQFPKELESLKTAANGDKRIIFIDSNILTEEQTALMTLCNSYVSLHRAEGFGLGLAEAMLLGKPVIATGYSGNLEFMNPQNSFLIPYKMKRLEKHEYPDAYGQYWADPDIFEAAKIMKSIFENEYLRTSTGLVAKKYIEAHHSTKMMGNHIKNRLLGIQNRNNFK